MADPSSDGSTSPTASDPEIAETLAYVRRTLEVIAFLLAALLVQSGGIGVIVGTGAIFVVLWNAAGW